jgi:hypothetical protein
MSKPVTGPADPLGWATKPRSPISLAVIMKKADSDRQFRAIRDRLIKDGICTESGRLLFRWTGIAWEQAT